MVTTQDTRAEYATAMSHMNDSLRGLERQGHDGRHQSCDDCIRYDIWHGALNGLLHQWERADG